ncbi:MAG: MarR family transcriptional regulator [Porticoccaceae bacterium]|nr:MarR family transcriptional regulator [Porticoccaceae bacterium]HLS98720.1 MarR family transcriptional regulator [Porticoccaceae bacterium]
MAKSPTPAGDNLKLDNQLCFALHALSRRVTARYRPLLDALGITYPQYLVMLVLWESQGDAPPENFEGITLKFLGERLLLDSGTLTPLLKRLEATGLVQRHRGARDERELRIKLTEKGLGLRDSAAKIPEQLACDYNLPEEKLALLHTELRELLALIKD